MSLTDAIREKFTDDFDAESIAKDVWREIEVAGEQEQFLFPLLRNEVVRLRRDRTRSLGDAWAKEIVASMPAPEIPEMRTVNPWKTIEAVRAGMSEKLKRLILNGELQLEGRTVPLIKATEADVDEKLEQESNRLRGLAQSVQVLRELKSFFSLGIENLGQLI